MAQQVMMKHPSTGIIKTGFYGFSWTTFFWGGFPALFRGQIVMGLLVIVLQILTFGFAGLIWAFFYNKKYTTDLLEKGYVYTDSPEKIAAAKIKLGVA